jgi:hypothetical protein
MIVGICASCRHPNVHTERQAANDIEAMATTVKTVMTLNANQRQLPRLQTKNPWGETHQCETLIHHSPYFSNWFLELYCSEAPWE